MVKSVYPGASAAMMDTAMVVAGGLLYFTAYTGNTGVELWKSDGTAVGTVMVKDIRPGPESSGPYYLDGAGRPDCLPGA